MTITEFAESRGVEPQAVSRYLSRHPEIKGTCKRLRKGVELSDTALEALEKQYPIPKPVQIITGVPQEEYNALLKDFAAAEKQLAATEKQLAELQEKRVQETNLLMETKEKLYQLEDKSQKDLQSEKERADSAEAEIARLKSRSLWQRIINV